jgi:hypothetical protein
MARPPERGFVMDRAGQEMSVLHVALFVEHQFRALMVIDFAVVPKPLRETVLDYRKG